MGASRLRVLFDVMLLESLPQTFVGLRNGVSLALVIIVVAEMFIGSQDGLGHSVFEAQQLFEMPRMYAAIFAAGALGYGLNLLFLVIERRFVHWSGKVATHGRQNSCSANPHASWRGSSPRAPSVRWKCSTLILAAIEALNPQAQRHRHAGRRSGARCRATRPKAQ